ncbi:peptidylprolyl isomerase [Rickettsiella grylli]|uniref:Peptidyl prolyl cis-trans isomerase D n=1 Tax=Rickettsiella grylli TaxID=59196 RepID=A8PPH9_9COXI|nr:peptidylprolyl isomerase [Rickettsiella grylli]EDP45936.1 putative peptidyl prolyl cis-trans isomerase D [Rickettsiella grylli]
MLQSIRDKSQGWITNTVIGLLIIIFALWGIHGYVVFHESGNNKIVAKIAGQLLRQSDFEKIYQRAYQQNRDYLNQSFSHDKKKVEALKEQVVREWEITQVLVYAALQSKYRISQTLIDSFLLQVPAFQSAGQFSIEKFYSVLRANDYTKLEFLEEIKKMLLINQVQQGITQSAFVLPQDIRNYIEYNHQKRDFSYLIVPYSMFLNQQNIPDSRIFAYYQENKQLFRQPEQVSIEYVQLSLKNEKNFLESRDKLAHLTYVHPDSLAIAANTLGLKIRSTPFFGKTGGQQGLSKNPKIITAAFSRDVLQGNNSAVIDLNTNTAVVLRIKKYNSEHRQLFNEVKEKIKKILNKQYAITKAQQFGENLLRDPHKIEMSSMEKISQKLKWHFMKQIDRQDKKLNKELLDAVFRLLPPGKNVPDSFWMKGFRLKNGDYALIKLITVYNQQNLPLTRAVSASYRKEIANGFGQLDYALYTQCVLKKFKLTS